MEKDTLDTAISLLCELHNMGCTEEEIKEVIIRMWIEHTDETLTTLKAALRHWTSLLTNLLRLGIERHL